MNTISLKKLKVNKAFSHETPCFTAIVCLNGEEIAHVKNSGTGGCCTYTPVDGKDWNHFEPLEKAAKEIKWKNKFEHLDAVVYDLMNKIEDEKFHATQVKETQFAIVGQRGNEYNICKPFRIKIDLKEAMKNDSYAAHIKNCIAGMKMEGFTILNQNL